ncbi:MAG: flagellar biosynthesis protein FlhF, partial [Gammaproteobacteria bacterium]|nr:flagellar biosynthesis protein FlhF [Gammaproteobacteria bacterium]
MKLKRFTAPDIRQAMTKVRAELGGDAVILSNRKTDDGVEIIAATDYDDAVIDNPGKIAEAASAFASSAPASRNSQASKNTQRVIKARSPSTRKG